MGLDAHVCCNCIRDGLAPPHPFPEMMVFDDTAEPTLKSNQEISMDQWLKHDAWYEHSCSHSGRIIKKRLGNISRIAHIRDYLESRAPISFLLMKEQIVHDGAHSGDCIDTADSLRLLNEAQQLRETAADPIIVKFAEAMIELAEASVATGNPIVF
jgi:hypothetical protein